MTGDDAVLYSFRRCPFAMRARMALAISGTTVVIREVALRQKPAELSAASPKATVPVLVLGGGAVIDESLEIMRWALRRNDPEGWLAGDDVALIDLFDRQFKTHLDDYKYAAPRGKDPEACRAAGVAMLDQLESRLADYGQLCAARRTMADIAILPFVRQFAAIDPAWFAAQPIPHVRHWLDGHVRSPLFLSTMARFPPWQAGDTAILWPSTPPA